MWGDIAIAFLLAFIVTFMATPYRKIKEECIKRQCPNLVDQQSY